MIFVLVAFGSAFGVAYWLVINSTSLSIAVHTMDMLFSRGVGCTFGSLLALVPLVVMCCPFSDVYKCFAPALQGVCSIGT